MNGIFRLPEAVRHDPTIDVWLKEQAPELGAIARMWFQRIHGAELNDPTGLLVGSGKRMRHVKVKPGVDLDSAALAALIVAAYEDIKLRLAAERRSG